MGSSWTPGAKSTAVGFRGSGGGFGVCPVCPGPRGGGLRTGGGVTTDTNGGALLGGQSGLCAKLLVAEGWDTDTSWIGDRSICELRELLVAPATSSVSLFRWWQAKRHSHSVICWTKCQAVSWLLHTALDFVFSSVFPPAIPTSGVTGVFGLCRAFASCGAVGIGLGVALLGRMRRSWQRVVLV